MISGGGREGSADERELRQILDLTPQHITEFGPDGRRLYKTAPLSTTTGSPMRSGKALNPKRCSSRGCGPCDAEQPGNFQSGSAFETEMRLRKETGSVAGSGPLRPMLASKGSVTSFVCGRHRYL